MKVNILKRTRENLSNYKLPLENIYKKSRTRLKQDESFIECEHEIKTSISENIYDLPIPFNEKQWRYAKSFIIHPRVDVLRYYTKQLTNPLSTDEEKEEACIVLGELYSRFPIDHRTYKGTHVFHEEWFFTKQFKSTKEFKTFKSLLKNFEKKYCDIMIEFSFFQKCSIGFYLLAKNSYSSLEALLRLVREIDRMNRSFIEYSLQVPVECIDLQSYCLELLEKTEDKKTHQQTVYFREALFYRAEGLFFRTFQSDGYNTCNSDVVNKTFFYYKQASLNGSHKAKLRIAQINARKDETSDLKDITDSIFEYGVTEIYDEDNNINLKRAFKYYNILGDDQNCPLDILFHVSLFYIRVGKNQSELPDIEFSDFLDEQERMKYLKKGVDILHKICQKAYNIYDNPSENIGFIIEDNTLYENYISTPLFFASDYLRRIYEKGDEEMGINTSVTNTVKYASITAMCTINENVLPGFNGLGHILSRILENDIDTMLIQPLMRVDTFLIKLLEIGYSKRGNDCAVSLLSYLYRSGFGRIEKNIKLSIYFRKLSILSHNCNLIDHLSYIKDYYIEKGKINKLLDVILECYKKFIVLPDDAIWELSSVVYHILSKYEYRKKIEWSTSRHFFWVQTPMDFLNSLDKHSQCLLFPDRYATILLLISKHRSNSNFQYIRTCFPKNIAIMIMKYLFAFT